jgi:hypothetical protein
MRTSYVPVMHCEKMAVTNMSFRQRAVVKFLVKEGNSAAVSYERLSGMYGDTCMGASSVRRWVKHFKDGNTDIADQPRCGRCNWAQQAKSRRAHHTRPKDNSQINCGAAWGGAQCGPGDDGNFGISESLFQLGSPFAYGYRGIWNGWELLSHPSYSPDLAHWIASCSSPWKITREITTTRLTRQSRKPREAGWNRLLLLQRHF